MWRFSLFIALISVFAVPALSHPASSVNVESGSAIYRDLDALEVMGLIPSSLLSTRPISRLEAVRLLFEAEYSLQTLTGRKKERASAVIKRLERELSGETDKTGALIVKPVDRAYAKFLYAGSAPHFPSVNNNGDEFKEGPNARAGFAFTAEAFGAFSIYLNPEYRLDDGSRIELKTGYAEAALWGLEVEAGRDSLWWGQGYHGSLILSNNAEPFEMVRAASQHPFLLPWIFRVLGPMRPTIFLATLEEERDFPGANLFGMRLAFKPAPSFEFALSRVLLFGGKGRAGLGSDDLMGLFIAADDAEHSSASIDGDQIASIDFAYIFLNDNAFLPFSSMKLYGEIGAEDSSGDTKTPTSKAYLAGALVDEPFWLENTSLRAEWAQTSRWDRLGDRAWYRHHIYTDGYTYNCRVVGHHMGSDAIELFLRAEYRFQGGTILGVEADFERSEVHTSDQKRAWYAVDIEYQAKDNIILKAGVGNEESDFDGEGGMAAWTGIDYLF
ncbi:MAG: hypothetical protein HY955_02560 [Deltaproteobacteria bacterium]|nr:hypothetical protein [Deltaproteobacteria bacterium]